MATPSTDNRPQAPLTRSRHGRVLGGVCAGLAQQRGLPAGWLRVAFVLGVLAGGLGALVYLACWLIIPGQDAGEEAAGARGVVVLAQVCAALAGLASLAVAGAAATLFGFGWAVVAIAATALAGALVCWPRVGPGWALLPVMALTVPSVAVAAGGLHLSPRATDVLVAPARIADIPARGYESGLGTMLIDLRATPLPASGAVHLKIRAGVRRTIVALPHDRCVHVRLHWSIDRVVAQAALLVTRRSYPSYENVSVLGRTRFEHAGEITGLGHATPGPTLTVDFDSLGGGLYIRDYPDGLDPNTNPDWPGYPVFPEHRPDTTGLTSQERHTEIAAWKVRHAQQVRSQHRYERLISGPCRVTS